MIPMVCAGVSTSCCPRRWRTTTVTSSPSWSPWAWTACSYRSPSRATGACWLGDAPGTRAVVQPDAPGPAKPCHVRPPPPSTSPTALPSLSLHTSFIVLRTRSFVNVRCRRPPIPISAYLIHGSTLPFIRGCAVFLPTIRLPASTTPSRVPLCVPHR